MTHYLKRIFNRRQTPQSEPIPGTAQVPNSAGGYAWPVDDWVRLDRFLVLGSEGGSYYASERKLTVENAQAVSRCVAADGLRAVARIVAISDAGRAPKNDPALLALAMAASLGDERTRRAAFDALPKVARTSTHLFHFAEYLQGLRGWGRGARRAVAGWYEAQPAEKLAYQAVKYQGRDGWSHRDLLRLGHPVATDAAQNAVFRWITRGWPEAEPAPTGGAEQAAEVAEPAQLLFPAAETPPLILAFEKVKRATAAAEVARLVREHRLPREAVPTQWLNDREVWAALLEEMPITAMIRNLATMTRIGLLAPMSEAASRIAAELTDGERLAAARVHPVAVLAALLTYQSGRGLRGRGEWEPVSQVVDALDRAFYLSFGNVTPTNRRLVLALDVSGSMGTGAVAGMLGLTPRAASAAMALVTAAIERDYAIVAFSTKGSYGNNADNLLAPVSISPRQRLDDVVKAIEEIPFGGTDCSLPMLWALENGVVADAFVIYTDSETWAGEIHAAQALRRYRERTGIAARLVVVGMVSNGFTIADPQDAGMLDVVGFDTATPELIGGFVRGEL